MCQIFVENCREDNEQVVLFYYWILDICECHEDLQETNVSKKLKDSLQLPQDKALIVECLWLLDHRLFKVFYLLDRIILWIIFHTCKYIHDSFSLLRYYFFGFHVYLL